MSKNKYLNEIVVAAAQFDVKIFDKKYNFNMMEKMVRETVEKYSADLVVFPEASAAGYCFHDRTEAEKSAIEENGKEMQQLKKISEELNVSIVFGATEKMEDKLYNSAFFIEPDGKVIKYHKTHLPFLGLDKFVEAGNELAVFETRFGKVGMIICYDLRFPEPCRELSLKGARLIIGPTNLPVGGESHLDYFTRARACENRIFLISCNRCGDERGFHFIGRAQIVDYTGKILCQAKEESEIIHAKINLALAEEKNIIVVPNDYETHIFEDRNPSIYGSITAEINADGSLKQ